MDPIKEAFSKVKEDMDNLKEEILSLNNSLEEIKRTLNKLYKKQADEAINQLQQEENPTLNSSVGVIPTHNLPLYGLKEQDMDISTGNGGVPTDRQTDQQTDRHTHPTHENRSNSTFKADFISHQILKDDSIDHLDKVSQVLESLDSIKKDLRIKVKRLTSQEMLIFSTIYQLEEEKFTVDYSLLASKLTLSESSIRDYILKIIKKGIPIAKVKENNKKIILSISSDFKRIAPLSTILALREI